MAKALFLPVCFLLILSCGNFKNKSNGEVQDAQADCPAFVAVGRVKICLPQIDSMVEALDDSIVKSWADRHEIKGNTVLSMFLRNPTRYQVNDAGEKTYDDFFKVFQVDMLKDKDTDMAYLNDVANSITTTNTFHNWGETQKALESDYKFIPPDQAYFIDSYSPHPQVRSFVVLYRYNPGKYETLLMGVMNIMLIKKRLVGLTYYKAFTGQETLGKARTKNDAIVGKVMAVNEEQAEGSKQ